MLLGADEIQAIIAIADRGGGRITPEQVVAAAADPSHPLHARFTWDDAAAATKQRLAEARALIRTVRVEIIAGERLVVVPRYLRDPAQDRQSQGYVSLHILRSDDDAARDAMLAEMKRASSALTRARSVAVALGFEAEVDALLARVASVQDRIATVADGPS